MKKYTIGIMSSIIAIFLLLALFLFLCSSCSTEGSPSDSKDNQCEDSIEYLDECLGGQFEDAMGISVSDGIEECDPNDSTDKCVIDCYQKNTGCDDYVDCADVCIF